MERPGVRIKDDGTLKMREFVKKVKTGMQRGSKQMERGNGHNSQIHSKSPATQRYNNQTNSKRPQC